jgi:putative ABC transport system permease protein
LVTKLVIENLKHRPIRTTLTVVAIAIQVTLVLTIVGLSRGLIEASRSRTRGTGADIMIRPPGTSVIGMTYAPMSEALIDFIQKQPHVALATGVLVHPVGGLDTIQGIDYDSFTRMSGGLRFLEGGPFQQDRDILVDEYFARQKQLKPGSKVTLGNVEWTVRGIVESGKLSRTFVQLRVLQELTANPGRVSAIYVKADDPRNVQTLVNQLKQQLPGYQIYSIEEFVSLVSVENIPGLNPFITVIVGLAVVFGFIVVFLAMYTAVLERTREIGILKALGASPPYVLGMLLRETVLLALAGSLLGIGLSFLTRWLIMALVPASLPVVNVPDWWWRAALISLAAAVLGAVYPGLKAARQDAIEALAYE